MRFLMQILQGALIGVGAVLPGISGGVLCVVFGIYKTIIELLANPIRNFKTHVPKLIPVILGGVIGFLGIANILSILLKRYPAQSVCLFIGLTSGMLPSLFREADKEGDNRLSYFVMLAAMAVTFTVLIVLQIFSVEITPGFIWYIFCGFCLALSVIAPGISFSTLLMPLGLYEPFVAGIGHLDFSILIPVGIGGLTTVLFLSKVINTLFDNHYSIAFHAIIGIVMAATIVIIPFQSFVLSLSNCIVNVACIVVGMIGVLLLDEFNQKFEM